MTILKPLSALVIALSVFSTNVFSMDQDENVFGFGGPHHSTIPVPIKEDVDEKTEDVDEKTPIIKKEKGAVLDN